MGIKAPSEPSGPSSMDWGYWVRIAIARRSAGFQAFSTALLCLGMFSGPNAVLAQGAADANPPDFTGVWTWNLSEGENPVQTLREQARDLPFNAAARPRIGEYRKMASLSLENPGSMCVQFGMPQAMLFSGGYPMEIIQRPEQITVIFEAYSEVRRIFMEPHPYRADEEWPSLIGFSTGHWEGDTLVVRTSRLKEQLTGDFPHSADAVIEERYQLHVQDDGTPIIVNDWKMTDPSFYTEPVAHRREWKPLGDDGHLHEYACMEDQWVEREAYLLERLRSGDPVIANQKDEQH
jgi:hypothetical protein